MALAFAWGLLAASSLVLGAILALRLDISRRAIGLIMAFGSGVLISAVAFDLIDEAAAGSTGHGAIALGIFAGCGAFSVGDWLIGRSGGAERKDPGGSQESGSALAIVLGTVLDGIPESMVIGVTLLEGGKVSIAYLAAVFISNLPEAISSSAGLATSGWQKARILHLWIGVALLSGFAALVGYVIFQNASQDTIAFVLSFAAGSILTMLSTTMMPEAFEYGGNLVGVLTTLGFGVAYALHAFL